MFYHNINQVLINLGSFEIRYYGLFYAISFIIAYFLIYHLAKQKKLDISKDDVSDLVIYLIAGIILVVCAAALVGCETMQGFGKDVQGGGRSIQKAAD